ncbi:hypothetical protein SAMN05444166_7075 [Singulisphaera sp. GP187]|uniref:hypothetical protein n=1 Tax=Singulisphaera sp. GP187 TaxID=1882752 RepID=UPI000929AA7F|nr:hypothetical protein [Singulisphaera sp. GP187]SIO62536.1 hypothetical protein SAMN05444166_7075 [Singulisphaera sp. GP187]
MRVRRWFRPVVLDDLECRVVPSTASVALPPALFGHTVPLPPQLQNGGQAQEAFDAFRQRYAQAIQTVLLGPGPNGSIDPEANREAFDAVVKQALTSLTSQLVQSLGNVSLNSPEVAQVVDAILGDGPDSLENQLLGLSTATIVQDAAAGTLTGDTLHTIVQAATQVTQSVVNGPNSPLVIQAIVPATTAVVTSGNDDATIELSSQSLTGVRNAFSEFMDDYYQEVKNILLAPDPHGKIDPAASRPDFDAKITVSLQALLDEVSESGAFRRATREQTAGIQEQILGNDSSSLKNQLAALASPAGREATLVRDFTLGSFRTIVGLFTRISEGISGT